jgi:hypothetical protein
MYFFLQKFHSGWAYLALILLVFATANAFFGLNAKSVFTAKDKKIALFALIATHIQLLVGLVLYFLSPIGLAALSQMADGILRLTVLEHPLTNIIAIVLITIGWSKHKKHTEDVKKFKTIAMFYTIGLLLILSRIPWHLWF